MKNKQSLYPATPMLDKMVSVRDELRTIGQFLEWLQEDELYLAEYVGGELVPYIVSSENLLVRYFGIDLKQAEEERVAVLEHASSIRKTNEQ